MHKSVKIDLIGSATIGFGWHKSLKEREGIKEKKEFEWIQLEKEGWKKLFFSFFFSFSKSDSTNCNFKVGYVFPYPLLHFLKLIKRKGGLKNLECVSPSFNVCEIYFDT